MTVAPTGRVRARAGYEVATLPCLLLELLITDLTCLVRSLRLGNTMHSQVTHDFSFKTVKPLKLQVSTTVIPRLTKIIRYGITFVSRNVISRRFL